MDTDERVLDFEEDDDEGLGLELLLRALAGVVFLALLWDVSQREWVSGDIMDTIENLSVEEWPVFESDWVEIPLAAKDASFVAGFPGAVKQFQSDEDRIILRRVDRPTRKLHPAADCFKAIGYVTYPEPAYRDLTGSLWRQTRVEKKGERLAVFERIVSADGSEWMDVSKWYWQNLLGRSEGPWYAVTRVKHL